MNVVGGIVFLVLLITGHKVHRIQNAFYIMAGKDWGGLTLGCFIIVDDEPTKHILTHEYGHTYQNIIFGPLFPFLVGIPSAIRYWYREYLVRKKGKRYKDLPDYESIWFEGQATKLGARFLTKTI